MSCYLTLARQHWGADLPDWVEALAAEANRTSQNQAAKQIGYSGSAVSGVFRRSYPSLSNIEVAVRGVFLSETVECPVLGEIGKNVCLTWRKRDFSNTNTRSIQMFRACNRCPKNARKEENE